MAYLSSADRETVLILAGVISAIDLIISTNSVRSRDSVEDLKAITDHAATALARYLEGVEMSTLEAIQRNVKATTIYLGINKHNTDEIEDLVVKRSDLESLLSDVITECSMCDLSGKPAKKCKRRKLLMKIGLLGTEGQECPYSLAK
jgi:hypothetical protein